MKNLWVIGSLVGIGLLALIALVINHHLVNPQVLLIRNHIQTNYVKTPQTTENCAQFPLTIGCETASSLINICSKQYPTYPSITDILTTKYNPNLGVYTGTISKVDLKMQTITVTSQKSNNSFAFNGSVIDGKIYNIHSVLVNNISLIPTGGKVFVSFPCNQKPGVFTLNKIQMIK